MSNCTLSKLLLLVLYMIYYLKTKNSLEMFKTASSLLISSKCMQAAGKDGCGICSPQMQMLCGHNSCNYKIWLILVSIMI